MFSLVLGTRMVRPATIREFDILLSTMSSGTVAPILAAISLSVASLNRVRASSNIVPHRDAKEAGGKCLH